MARAILGASLVLAMSCGGSSGDGDSRLHGAWALSIDGCEMSYAFDPGGSFEVGYACLLDDGSIGVEVIGGSYVVDGDEVELMPESSTCAGASGETETVRFDFNAGGDLLLRFSEGTLVLVETESRGSEAGAVFRLGCYDGDSFEIRGAEPI